MGQMAPTFATVADRLWDGFQTSARICKRLHVMYQPGVRFYRPIDLVKTLNEANIRSMVVGNYGSGAWRHEPQANGDIDVLVGSRSLKAAADVVAARFRRLVRSDENDAVAFHDKKSRWTSAVYHLHRPTTHEGQHFELHAKSCDHATIRSGAAPIAGARLGP